MSIEKSKNSIRLSVLNSQVRERVEKFDTGNDGELDINSTYVECGKTNEKASLPFLEFGSVEAFNKSRSGIFYNIFNLAKKDFY